MDLISTLAGTLGVNPEQAEAVAGSVLGGVSDAVKDRFDDDTASGLEAAVPELAGWKDKAAALLGGGDSEPAESGGLLGGAAGMLGGAGGLLGAAAGALGGDGLKDVAAVAGILDKLGIDGAKAALVAPVVLDFLKKRLDPGLLDKVLQVAPLLSGGDKGGIAGALGGLFG